MILNAVFLKNYTFKTVNITMICILFILHFKNKQFLITKNIHRYWDNIKTGSV